jgi:hypothetical protein
LFAAIRNAMHINVASLYRAGRLVNQIKNLAVDTGQLPRLKRSPDPGDNYLRALVEAGNADYLATGARGCQDTGGRHGRFLGLSRLIAGQLKNVSAKKAEVQSMAIAAAMIGAITLARIVPDSRISNSILVGTRDHILKSVRRKR